MSCTALSPAGSVTLGGKRYLIVFLHPRAVSLYELHYPERAKELFEKAEANAKAKYERLVKFVDFYS